MECVNEVSYAIKGNTRCEKVVRQHYLRNDISFGRSVYPILDHTVLINQSDAIQTPTFTDFIIPQTALNYVSTSSKLMYRKIRELISNSNGGAFLFLNEFFRETYVSATPEESLLHRNFRAYITAYNYLSTHYNLFGAKVVLVTNTETLKNDFIAQNVNAMTFSEFVLRYHSNDTQIQDRITESSNESGSGNTLYPEYLPRDVLLKGINEKTLLQGSIRMNRFNYKEATVYTSDKEEVLVCGLNDINRAIEGDIVAIELLPKENWKNESNDIALDMTSNDAQTEKSLNINNIVVDLNSMEDVGRPTAKVVGIIKKNWKPLPGHIKTDAHGSYSSSALFLPSDKRYPPIRIKVRDPARISKQRILVVIDTWDGFSKYPSGHYVSTLGNVGDESSETEAILELHEIPHYEFPDVVLKCLPSLPFTVTDEYLKGRRDFRNCRVCSIDPVGCTDIDDALHCKILPNGHYEVGVHIADVSCFVKPHTELDEEASKRGTTVYLADLICSITQDVDTLTFSVVWELDENANIIDCTYHKGVVHSYRSYAYGEAQAVIDDKSNTSLEAQELRALLKLSKKLKQYRIDNDDKFNPVGVSVYKTYETNSMVEEYMLLANVWVAKKIHNAFPQCSMLRRHPPPDEHTFEWLSRVMKSRGSSLDFSSSKALSDSLERCGRSQDPSIGKIMRILVTRCMQQAKYFSSGYFPANEFRHYGLAAEIYTHFTSPIRRYADVMVHRLLAMAIGFDRVEVSITKESVKEIADNLNHRHTMAQYAGRASVQMYTLILLKNKQEKVDGYVVKVKKNGVVVNIPQYGMEVIVIIDKRLGFVFNEKENTLSNMSIQFNVFDKVTGILSIDKSNEFELKPILKLLTPSLE
ncbi:Ribosomal RNA-processing protein 44 [Entamoeba marina]